MKNTAPIGLGICAVAALFGLVGGTMLFVMWDYSFIGAAFMAAIIALIVAIILWLGWRPANDNSRDMAAEAHRAGEAPTVASTGGGYVPSSASASASASAATAAPAAAAPAADPAPTAPVAEPAPAAAEAAPAAADEAPAIKSTLLPGETELSERKGDWKYEGDAGADSGTDAASSAASADADLGKDYDGDGVLEGTNEGSKPATLAAARDGGPDNLKEIKGVGPKLEKLLHSMGFFHFDQVAAWTADEIAWVDANLEGFKGRVSRDEWVAQAKILASGGETEFSKKVDKGGVY